VRCSPHTCRHTFACNYLKNGGDVYTLSRLLGHTSVSVTEVYLRAVKAQDARRHHISLMERVT
jgi:integrase/recombinase XerD